MSDWMDKYRNKMLKTTMTTLRDARERQFYVCDDGDSLSTTRTCVGTSCYVRARRECRGKVIGDFHTHPGAPPNPSDGDFIHHYSNRIRDFCIGSGNAELLPPKTIIKDGRKVMRHMIGWSLDGAPEVQCFRWADRARVTKWFRENKLSPNLEIEGRFSIQKHRAALEEVGTAFYRDVWFGQAHPPLMEFLRKYRGRRR